MPSDGTGKRGTAYPSTHFRNSVLRLNRRLWRFLGHRFDAAVPRIVESMPFHIKRSQADALAPPPSSPANP